MRHPCKNSCPDRAWPGCRHGCLKYEAWQQLKEHEREEKSRQNLLNDYIVSACRAAKKGARRHDGRHIR